MFSGLSQRVIRTTVATVLAFTGLFLLSMPIAKAAESQVLSVYITNAGAWLSYGSSTNSQPQYHTSLNTWESADMFGHPPNLLFNDSPLALFRQLVTQAAPSLKSLIDERQPLQVYLAAAGADKAKTMPLPKSAALVSILSSAQAEQCYQPDKNRAEFFACAFQQELMEQLLDTTDSSQVNVVLEQDHHLITAMAALYQGQQAADEPSIVVHSTTLAQPYLVINGRAKDLGPWVFEPLVGHGGIHQIGKLLQTYLSQHENPDDPLRYVVSRDPLTANHPGGAEANMKRLGLGKGFNNFGQIAGETANGSNQQRVNLEAGKKALYQQATLAAMPLLHAARQDMIRLSLHIYALQEPRFAGKTPKLIIVGEEASLMFANEKIFRASAYKVLTEQGHELLPETLYEHRPALADPEQQRHWLREKAIPMLNNVTVLPSMRMPALQHQVALKKTGH